LVDGTRDRPPGRTAENWSRKDHIRAGAVSGPWRSAPRPVPAPVDLPPPGPLVLPVPASPAAAVPLRPASKPPHTPPHEAGAAQAAEPEFREHTRRRTLSMTVWIGAGLVFATATVTAAFLFRPDPAQVPDELPPVVAVDPAPQAAATAPAAALAAIGPVRLRIGPDFPAERRQAILDTLAAAGVTRVQVEPLPFAVTNSRVGYYRPEDIAAAEALAALVGAVAGGAEIGVRDYGQLLPDPEPGRLDLWVGGA
jgi:hypothetical protein